MSKTQNTENKRGFAEASAPKLPTLVCVGQVGEVGEAKVSESGEYVVQPIKINALGAGKNMTIYFLYRPEWFREGFRPDELKKLEDGKGKHFVYAKMISSRGGISFLRGLCGSQEAFDSLAEELFNLEEITLESVQETFKNFFENNVTETGDKVLVGYVLKQDRTDTGEKDEEGHKIYLLENRYNVDKFFEPTEDQLKRWQASADRSNGLTKVTYHSEPF